MVSGTKTLTLAFYNCRVLYPYSLQYMIIQNKYQQKNPQSKHHHHANNDKYNKHHTQTHQTHMHTYHIHRYTHHTYTHTRYTEKHTHTTYTQIQTHTQMMWYSPLYALNMVYYHWLIKKFLRPMAGQNRARQEN